LHVNVYIANPGAVRVESAEFVFSQLSKCVWDFERRETYIPLFSLHPMQTTTPFRKRKEWKMGEWQAEAAKAYLALKMHLWKSAPIQKCKVEAVNSRVSLQRPYRLSWVQIREGGRGAPFR
jgi:hypothetical protein